MLHLHRSLLRPPQGKDLLTQKIPVWQQACSDPNKLPERAMLLAQQMGSALGGTSPLHGSKSNLVISDPIPGAQPLPVPPELAVFMGSGLGHPAVSGGSDSWSQFLLSACTESACCPCVCMGVYRALSSHKSLH